MDEYIKYLKDKYCLYEFEECVTKIEKDIETALEEKQVSNQPSNCAFLLETLGKSLVTTREIIVLCSNGLPDGALSLARNLCEQFIITVFIEGNKNNESFDKMLSMYFDDYEVRKLKNLVIQYPEHQDEFEAELEKIKGKYSISNKTLNDYWWSGKKTFRDIFDEVCKKTDLPNLLLNVNELYKEACNTLHASYFGNTTRLGRTSSAIEMGPWENGQEKSLYVCAVSLICTVSYTYDALEINESKMNCINKKLNELGAFYMTILNKQIEKE